MYFPKTVAIWELFLLMQKHIVGNKINFYVHFVVYVVLQYAANSQLKKG